MHFLCYIKLRDIKSKCIDSSFKMWEMRFFAALVANVESAPKQNCPHPPLAFIQHELTLRSGWRSKQPWHSPMVIGLWCLYYPASQAGIEIFHRCRHHRLILTVEEAPRSWRGLTAFASSFSMPSTLLSLQKSLAHARRCLHILFDPGSRKWATSVYLTFSQYWATATALCLPPRSEPSN